MFFHYPDILNGKDVLEIGCGAGRFTEYLVKYAKKCVSIDLSSAIYHNVSSDSKNLQLINFKKEISIVIFFVIKI